MTDPTIPEPTEPFDTRTLDRVLFLLQNMPGHDLSWEWMTRRKDGTYLDRGEVLTLLEKLKTDPDTKPEPFKEGASDF